jgi:hypothetical protein
MRPIVIALALVLFSSHQAAAQSRSGSSEGHAAVWTTVGAGAGFGVGLWAGLTAFDDSIDSDRKVWTTAIVSAAAGGVLGYFIGRHKKAGRKTGAAGATGAMGASGAMGATGASGAMGALSDAEIEGLAQSVRLTPLSERSIYSALSPSSGETRAARAAGK